MKQLEFTDKQFELLQEMVKFAHSQNHEPDNCWPSEIEIFKKLDILHHLYETT